LVTIATVTAAWGRHFKTQQGIRNLTDEEAAQIIAKDPVPA
jgi:catalase